MSITVKQTFLNIKSDFVKAAQVYKTPLTPARVLFFMITPSIVALMLYRLSHLLYMKNWRIPAWLLWMFNQYLTGTDIGPASVIGESCFIGHQVGTQIYGRIGKNATMFATPGIGGGRGEGDVGGGGGLPCIGDNLVMGGRATILGPLRVGDNVTIGACAFVVRDVPSGSVVNGRPSPIVTPSESTEKQDMAA